MRRNKLAPGQIVLASKKASTFDLTAAVLYSPQGQAGNAVQYITRNQALKKLQLRLSEFRSAAHCALCHSRGSARTVVTL